MGSGNLTPGGLASNFEAYTVISSSPGEALDVSGFDTFLTRHAGIILPIDEPALARAALNIIQRVKGKAKIENSKGETKYEIEIKQKKKTVELFFEADGMQIK